MVKIRLVSSPYIDYDSWLNDAQHPNLKSYIPLGLLSLIATLRYHGYSADLFEINEYWNKFYDFELPINYNYKKVAEAILSDDTNVVGFMTEYYTYHHILAISKEIKKFNPSVFVIFGGPQASAVDLKTCEFTGDVDAIVRGEGEVSFPNLIKALDKGVSIAKVAGLTIKIDGVPARTQNQPLLDDLDDLHFPAFDAVEISSSDLISIEAGRGCPFTCTFCSTNRFWKRRYRVKSPSRICSEMEFLRDNFGVINFSLIHDCLTADKREVIALCDEIDRRNLEISWGCSSRTDTMDKELAERMVNSGFTNIYFGLESGDSEIQQQIKKDLDLDRAFSIIRKVRELGVQVMTPFMVGFPGETRAKLTITFNAVHRALAEDVFIVQFFAVAPYGDTPLLDGHRETIKYSGHFLDLPLQASNRLARDHLMHKNPQIFSGHYHYQTNGIDNLVEGLDQFFPLLNEMRFTVMLIAYHSGDPLFLYQRWLEWLQSKTRNSSLATFRSYGTFREFGEFLDEVTEELLPEVPYLNELLDYERTRFSILKNAEELCDICNPHLAQDNISIQTRFHLNKGVIVKNYKYDIPLLIESVRAGNKCEPPCLNGALVFFQRNKRVHVLAVNSFSNELLTYCDEKMRVEDIVYRIQRRLQLSNKSMNKEELYNRCIDGLVELARSRLIIAGVAT